MFKANTLSLPFQLYATGRDCASMKAVVGEDALSAEDKLSLEFLDAFEKKFINQGAYENRTIYDSLDIAWSLMRMLPKEMLTRVNPKILKEFYGRRAQGTLKKVAEDADKQSTAGETKKKDKSTRDGDSKLVDDD